MKKVDFDVIAYHLALTYIIKNKAEPATTGIKRLLELISLYPFNLYYMKGKDMVLSDFCLGQSMMIVIPMRFIPVSFNMYNALYETYYRIEPQVWYLVQTQSQTKATGVTLPEVHGAKKTLDTRVLLEKQKPQIQAKQIVKIRAKLGRGRAGIRCKKTQPVADMTATASKSHKAPTIQNATKDNTDFPVPRQLITNETETITRKRYKVKIGSNLSTQTQFIDLHQGHQII